MTKKEWTNMSQDITCELCGATVPRANNNQRFCSDPCRIEYWKGKQQITNCVVCNDEFSTSRAKDTKTCSEFCKHVYYSVEQSKYTDDEIIHLALTNSGYGVKHFIKMLTISRDRLFDLREVFLEETKIDLYQVLNDDSDWGRHLSSTRFHDWTRTCPNPYMLRNVNHDRKKPKAFNWGPYEKR